MSSDSGDEKSNENTKNDDKKAMTAFTEMKGTYIGICVKMMEKYFADKPYSDMKDNTLQEISKEILNEIQMDEQNKGFKFIIILNMFENEAKGLSEGNCCLWEGEKDGFFKLKFPENPKENQVFVILSFYRISP